ncbi:MAG: rhodanese-like domain-containing protein [Burkholderiales bacterium]
MAVRVTVLDARPTEEYEAGHLRGAVNMPMAELEARPMELPRGGEVVVYGRNQSRTLSFEAVPLLRRRGLIARRLELGFREWKQRGYPSNSCECDECRWWCRCAFRTTRECDIVAIVYTARSSVKSLFYNNIL